MKVNPLRSYRMKMMLYTLLSISITFTIDIVIFYVYRFIHKFVIKSAANIATQDTAFDALTQNSLPNASLNGAAVPGSGSRGHFPWLLIFILVLISVVIFIVLFQIFTRKTVNYLHEITEAIQQISDGDFNTRIDVRYSDEFSVIADNINHMAMDLEFLNKSQLKAEATKNELITNVAHDLRTPLTSILGYLDILNTHPELPEEKRRDYIRIAYNKSVRLQTMIEDLFSFTKLSFGKMPIKAEHLDLVKLIEQEIEEFYPAFKDHNLTCEFKSSSASAMVLADGQLMARAFENLIGNAAKYGKDGKVIKITIKSEGTAVKICITNYGSVIPPEDLPYVFDKFYRVEQSRTETTGGTGLGLSIAKAIIEGHNGRICVKSSLNGGTTFEVTLNTIVNPS